MYGPIPTEIAVFADAGVAWNAGEWPTFFGGQRQVVSSVGVAVRARLFNLLILEFDVSNPFQRRGSGPVFQLNVSPGF
jgi:outer membrane protein assembly factor BamA